MTKLDITLAIAKKLGMEHTEVQMIVQFTLDRMTDEIGNNKRLELRGFGVFEVRLRKGRRSRNPKTGEQVFARARNVVRFAPGKEMREFLARKLSATL